MAVNDLFKEIGETLQTAAREGLRTGVETIRSVIAGKFLETPTGQEIVKEQTVKTAWGMLPVILGVVFGVWFLSRAIR